MPRRVAAPARRRCTAVLIDLHRRGVAAAPCAGRAAVLGLVGGSAAGELPGGHCGNRLHRLLLELIPGGAGRSLSAAQARVLVAKVKRATYLARRAAD